jgi:type I site-specific restriction endonuclease
VKVETGESVEDQILIAAIRTDGATQPRNAILCEIFNRHDTGCARFICGDTDNITRKAILRDFKDGHFRILSNVGVLTEGFDEPGIEFVVIARPTKHRALYAQMIGRGTRPLPGVVEAFDTSDLRRQAIRSSPKPHLEVLDFVGNAGRHKLISCADILGGNYDSDVVERAKRKARDAVDMRRALDEAQEELERQQQEERRVADARTRQRLRAKAKYNCTTINPFDLLDITPRREMAWHKARKPSEKQIDLLRKYGINNAAEMSFTQAGQLIQTFVDRRKNGLCTFKALRLHTGQNVRRSPRDH